MAVQDENGGFDDEGELYMSPPPPPPRNVFGFLLSCVLHPGVILPDIVVGSTSTAISDTAAAENNTIAVESNTTPAISIKMPLIRTRPTTSSATSDDSSNGLPLPTAGDGSSFVAALGSSDMSKTGRRYGKSTPLMRGSSRAQTYRKEVVTPAAALEEAAVVGGCPSGQNYYLSLIHI